MKRTGYLLRGIFLFFFVALWPAICFAQTWIQQFPTGSPPPTRYAAKYAYDEANDRLMVLGGDIIGAPYLDDVWVLVNATGASGTPAWIQLAPAGGPPLSNLESTAVYDPGTNRLTIHGGCYWNCSPALRQTWVLTNANGLGGAPQWIQLPDAPIVRAGHVAAYDPGSNRMIVFGGHQAFGYTDRNDVWVLIDANGMGSPAWMQLFPTGTPPAARGEIASGVYDPGSNRLILFGGRPTRTPPLNDVWVLTHANGLGGTPEWIQLFPIGTSPTPRNAHSLVYDSVRNRMIVFGGVTDVGTLTFFDEVWVLTEANGTGGTPEWIQVAPSGTPPAGRFWSTAGYSSANRRLVIATGRRDAPVFAKFNDVWVLVFNQAPVANAGTDQTVECCSSTGTPVTLDGTASSDPDGDALSYEWKDFGGNVVGNTATVNVTLPLGAHTFTLTVGDGKGGTASDSVVITVQDTTPPTLTLSTSSLTVVVPTASATGAAADLGGIATATDACDPDVTITNNAPALFPLGTSTATFTATDDSGNYSQKQLTVHVVYNFIGFLAPIRNDGSSIFKSGRTIPVKFQLTAADSSFVTNAVVTLQVFKFTDVVLGATEEITADAAGNSNMDNLFRYDAISNQYIYNLKTTGYTAGSYLLRATLNDGTAHDVIVSVRM